MCKRKTLLELGIEPRSEQCECSVLTAILFELIEMDAAKCKQYTLNEEMTTNTNLESRATAQ